MILQIAQLSAKVDGEHGRRQGIEGGLPVRFDPPDTLPTSKVHQS